jgi:hypothetical protein
VLKKLILLSLVTVGPYAFSLELELPIALIDAGYQAFGIAPYGYHVAEHRYDGHPGLDIEFIPGRKVRAAHGGILTFTTDSHDPSLKSVTIAFQEKGVNYQLFYSNIAGFEPGIDDGVTVVAGQVFGTPGTVIRNNGNAGSYTYAMTHFQLADNRLDNGLSNPTALSPEQFFTASASQDLQEIWRNAQYHQMICEPYLSNSRGMLPYPTITRLWTPVSESAYFIEFTCDFSQGSPELAYHYKLTSTDGMVIETGLAMVTAMTAGNSSIDLIPEGGNPRLGLVYIKDGHMRLAFSEPGGFRPEDLVNALEYTSQSATSCASIADAVCFKSNESPYRAGDTLALGVSLDWSKVLASTEMADFWVALKLPSGQLLFRQADNRWYSQGQAYLTQIHSALYEVNLLTMVLPAKLEPGNYTFYAALNQSGASLADMKSTLLSNLAIGRVYLMPPE